MHEDGPIYDNHDIKSQYVQISNDKFYINCTSFANNCYIIKNGICIQVLNIIEDTNNNIFFIGRKFTYVKGVYDKLYESSQFGIKMMTIENYNNLHS